MSVIHFVEKEIVNRFVDDCLSAGYRLSVSLERGYDVDEMLIGSRDREKIISEVFAGDDCHVFVHKGDYEIVQDGHIISEGWVYFVMGNSGWDVISDWTVCLDTDLDGALEVSRKYE